MKKVNLTNKKTVISAIALSAVMAVGGAMAYFTDIDSAKNQIEIGNVHIDLTEPKWDETPDENNNGIPDTAEKIVPGKTIEKDPMVTNTGKNDSYIYLTVSVPKADIITAAPDGTLNNNGEALTTQLFSYTANENWELLETDSSANDKNVYVYGYKTAVAPGASTDTLFDSVTFVNAIEGQGLEDKVFDIDIKASAIQSEETGTMKEAYKKFINQNS